ncbi:hypothetical protein CGUA_01770 [Corynebacterium guangdongense]|uniref:Uncharacterized protein n=1 Tax=Corynebacterium guangdongense TaxID=1783348 RepID=A0ABU1ZVW1_9CORY|nr:hypothetical protein [Corynebacterium guangdongense]WJZ16954.1 hypothetical protein CGUA_01770 [Corynebacterium guangdongense]
MMSLKIKGAHTTGRDCGTDRSDFLRHPTEGVAVIVADHDKAAVDETEKTAPPMHEAGGPDRLTGPPPHHHR